MRPKLLAVNVKLMDEEKEISVGRLQQLGVTASRAVAGQPASRGGIVKLIADLNSHCVRISLPPNSSLCYRGDYFLVDRQKYDPGEGGKRSVISGQTHRMGFAWIRNF